MAWLGRFWQRGWTSASAAAAPPVAALWVAICAAAPELIWQGLRIAAGHLTRADLVEAVLLGAILAFFVEPLMRHARDLARRGRVRGGPEPGSPLFAAALGLSFALVSVGVHDALITLVNKSNGGLSAAIRLTTAWAIVPGAVTLAWLGARRGRLVRLSGIAAALSGGIVGWVFSWSGPEVIDSVIPSVVILGIGYRRVRSGGGRGALMRCAPIVAAVGAAWLLLALALDYLLRLWHLEAWQVYRPGEAWVDVRFYAGWSLGLVLAPPPRDRADAPGKPVEQPIS